MERAGLYPIDYLPRGVRLTAYSIGEFAKASGLTPKALRLYDELRLLSPAEVDARSGYRHYDPAQLGRARLVARLRGLGMPLARIRVLCQLPAAGAAAEVVSYWRQVEADTVARGQLVAVLLEQFSQEDTTMNEIRPELELRCAVRTDRGRARPTNQDQAYGGARLFAVADGFGEGVDPPASGVAIAALESLDHSELAPAAVLDALGGGAQAAQLAVRDFATSDPARKAAGSTLTAMLFSASTFALAHIGDSRACLLRGGELTQLTHDHSYVQSLLDEGRLTAEEAASHPKRATLVRALFVADAQPDLHLREAHPGDRYLLCSDGLHAVVSGDDLGEVLETTPDPERAADRLVELANERGGPDNIACIVLDAIPRAG